MAPRDSNTAETDNRETDQVRGTAASELAATAWYRRHHVGLKERYVRDGVELSATAPHMGLDDELDLVLAEYTSPEELAALMGLVQRHRRQCIVDVVEEAIRAELATPPELVGTGQRRPSPSWFDSPLAERKQPRWFGSTLAEG